MLAGGISRISTACHPQGGGGPRVLVKAVTAPGQKKVLPGHGFGAARVGNKHSACGCAGVFPLMRRSNFMRKCLKMRAAWSDSKPSPHKMARTRVCAEHERQILKQGNVDAAGRVPFAGGRLCRYGRARQCAGSSGEGARVLRVV